ncbi:DNA circularization N-terminal domain-containing protein (plasmid) [Rouxiella badensis]|nr:DNA circularization N-terminal domain-containing protein [Rouxiella badensis]
MGDTFSWQDNLHKASFRGVPFAVEGGDGEFGRRQAVHEYPYRDSVWVEDMGRATRRITLTGYILQSSLLYTASDVMTQRNSLVAAAESSGAGTLIHPTLGELTVSIPPGGLKISESKDEARMFRFTLTAIESGLKVFAITSATDAASTVQTSWLSTVTTAAARAIAEVKGDMRSVTQAIKTLKSTLTFWTGMVTDTFNEATNLSNVLKSTFGSTRYGRYNTGSIGGNATGTSSTADNTADTDDYAGLVATKIAESIENSAAMSAAISTLLASTNIEDYAANVQAVVTEMVGSVAGGADLINALETLSDFSDSTYRPDSSDSAVASANQIFVNTLTTAAMAYAVSLYTPANYDEAANLTRRITDVLDAAIVAVADAGYDDVYLQLQELQSNVITTLETLGASLAHVQTVSFAKPLPALTLANRLYQDASRAEALVKMADPIHPAFMPTSFKALTS